FDEKSSKSKDREDSRTRYKSKPSRNLAMALSEYAPGSSIVMDGKVFKSGGVALNWQIPDDDAGIVENQLFRTAWKCKTCGQVGVSGIEYTRECYSCKNDIHEQNEIK